MAASITSTSIARYKANLAGNRNREENLMQNREQAEGYNGYLSNSAKANIRKKVAAMAYIAANSTAIETTLSGKEVTATEIKKKRSKFIKMSFLTLSLCAAQLHSDNEIKRCCLQPFLAELKRVYGLQNYVWTAESQQNGNIHFHIVLDKHIRKELVRKIWLLHLETLGYWKRSIIKNPPCTHIEGVSSYRGVACYVSKYIAKAEATGRKINGRLWGCSTELEAIVPMILSDEEMSIFDEEIRRATTMYIEEEYFNVSLLDIADCETLNWLYLNHIVNCLNAHAKRNE